MNTVSMLGRLTKDPRIEVAKNETFYVLFTLAVRENLEKTNYIPCIAFGDTAELIGNNLKKGNRIFATGALQSSYNGEKSSLLVRINRFEFTEAKNKTYKPSVSDFVEDEKIEPAFIDEMALDEDDDLPF